MSEKKVMILTIAYLVAVVLFGGGAIYFVHWNLLAKETTARDKLQAEVKMMQDKVRQLTKLMAEANELPARIEAVNDRVPTLEAGRFDQQIDHVYRMAKKAGVKINKEEKGRAPRRPGRGRTTTGSGTAGGTAAEEAYVQMTVQGGFFPLGKFVHLLEQREPLVVVMNFSISRGKSSQGSKVIPDKSMKILFKMFGFPEKKEKKKPGGRRG